MAKGAGFHYSSGMKFLSHHVHSVMFLLSILAGCSTPQKPTKADWESEVQKKLSLEQGQFQICSKFVQHSKAKEITVSMTFRLNPTGALETLWLDESEAWDTRFYDCLFNVIDRMDFPSYGEDISLEVQQDIIYKSREV